MAGARIDVAAVPAPVRLISISRAGALLESETRLAVGYHICLKLNARDATFLLTGLVLRSRTSTEDGYSISYESAVAFDDDFVLLDQDVPDGERGKLDASIASGLLQTRQLSRTTSVSPGSPASKNNGGQDALLAEADLPLSSGAEVRRMIGLQARPDNIANHLR